MSKLYQARQTSDLGRFYLPELDGLRFFAFLTVFLHHALGDSERLAEAVPSGWTGLTAGALRAGMFGVDLFFLLSSFLITSLLLREVRLTGRLDVKSFWIRRSLRIWPLYFFFIFLAGFVLPPRFYFIPPLETHHLAGLLTFTHNWVIAFTGVGRGSPTLLLWSVSLEEQFYFAWPLLILMVGIERLPAIGLAMIVCAFVARAVAIYAGASGLLLWLATPFRLEPLAAGALVALARERLPSLGNPFRLGMLLVGVAIPIAAVARAPDSIWSDLAIYPLVTLGCTLIFLAVLGSKWRLFSSGPLVYLGKISYGLYVFHQLAIYFSPRLTIPGLPMGRTLAAFLATVLLAAASYRFLEIPFLRLKERFAHVRSRSV
jgi:peptidoglycan/LPS O-acetylase OafA/YrhL